ncbi:MAG TPA: hypothetical protein VFU54_20250 [Actinomycetota bacterium]|nr:hypothetical protein [Actinomycetota bacterium]
MRTRDARVVYLVLESATALLHATAWTTAAVYLINTAHLGPLQLVLLGTVMEASVLVFEIPTGVVADAVGPLFLRAAQYGRLAAVVGIGLSVGLANRALGLPLVVAGLLQIALGGWLTLAMPETGFRPAAREQRSSWRQVVRTAHGGLAAARRDRVLLALFAVALFAGMSTEGIDRLWELHLLREVGFPVAGHLGPVGWFGVIELASLALGAAVIAPVRRRADTGDPRTLCGLLLGLTAVEAATLVAFGLAGGFGAAVAALLGYGGARALRDPLFDAWVVPMTPAAARATVLSAMGQADAAGEMLGGPAIGLVATVAAPGLAIVAAGAALIPVAVLLAGVRVRAIGPRSPRRTPGR